MINRRDFIKTSAALAAGATIVPGTLLASEAGIKEVGFQVWSIAKYLEKDFEGTMKQLSRIGYSQLELFGPYPFSTEKDKAIWKMITPMLTFSQSGYFGRTTKQFKKILKQYRFQSSSMHIGLDTLRNNIEETAEAAHILGQEYVCLPSIPEEERRTLDDYKRMADEFNVIGAKAKAAGIKLAYHNHGYGLSEMEGVIPFDYILEHTDPSLVFFEMDIYWTIAGGADAIKYLDENPGRFKMMHVKDMKKQVRFAGDGGDPKQWVELFPYITDAGSGVLDLSLILSHAKKSGVDYFFLENDAITDLTASLENGYRFLSTVKLDSN